MLPRIHLQGCHQGGPDKRLPSSGVFGRERRSTPLPVELVFSQRVVRYRNRTCDCQIKNLVL